MPVLRELAVGAYDDALPGDQKPPGTSWTSPRTGTAPLALDWYLVFVNAEGKVVTGGSATVAWYAVEFVGAAVNTPIVVDSAIVGALTSKRIVVGPGLYAWPIVSDMSPPTVPAKATQVDILDGGDGTYAISVVGEVTPYEFEASGNTLGEITDGLAALFVAHPTLTVAPAGDGYLLFSGAEDFDLVLDAPGESMSQVTYVDYSPPIAKIQILAAASAGVVADVGFDIDAIESAAEAGSAAALTEATSLFGSIYDLVNQGDGGNGSYTGATSYVLVAGQDGKIALQAITISSDKAITWSVGGQYFDWTAAHKCPAAGTVHLSNGGARGAFKTNQSDPLTLRVSDATAVVTATFATISLSQ